MKKFAVGILIIISFFVLTTSAAGQDYLFNVDKIDVHVFIQKDGTYFIDYTLVFTNNQFAPPIDFIDIGLPNSNLNVNQIHAQVDGKRIHKVSKAEYQGIGSGVALDLEDNAIQPGETSEVQVRIYGVRDVLYPDDEEENYISAGFEPVYFGSSYIEGKTDISVTFHLPPGVKPNEPRWHESPSSFKIAPETGFDKYERITYHWTNSEVLADKSYKFGASFPSKYVRSSNAEKPDVVKPDALKPKAKTSSDNSGDDGIIECLLSLFCWVPGIITALGAYIKKQQKSTYLSPKMAIEGHGIKRGLTAVEAAIVLEQPMEKVLTMILFSTIKKGAAIIINQDPLSLEIQDPLPEGLNKYEIDFLEAMQITDDVKKRIAMKNAMVNLVKSVAAKMKGFSRSETVAYYKKVVNRAWSQIETSESPKLKTKNFDRYIHWAMMDIGFEDRTKNLFSEKLVDVPVWWPSFDPGFRPHISTAPKTSSISLPSTDSGGGSLPQLSGSKFAASIVNSIQNFSSNVVGDISNFTLIVTHAINPNAISVQGSGGSGGWSCACACACAGCACACAGGGR